MKDHRNPKNILVHPAGYASQLSELEQDRDLPAIKRIEDHLSHRIRLGGAITYLDKDGNHVVEDRNGVRPYVPGDEIPLPPQSAELEIRELAFQHGIHADKSELDDWCETVSANAGDEIQSDEVELLIIGLGRENVVDGIELTKLHARYLDELQFNEETTDGALAAGA